MASAQQGPALLPLQSRTQRWRKLQLGPRQPDVARGSSRAVLGLQAHHSAGTIAGALVCPAKLLGRRPSARSRFCAPFEGGCRGSINGSKRALSQKTTDKCSAGLNDAGKRPKLRQRAEQWRKNRTLEESQRTPLLPHNCLREVKKSQNPYIFCRKLQWAPLGH